MAMDLPVTSLGIDPRQYRRGKPILSGSGVTAIKARGLRGIISETNHLYAYRGRTIGSEADWRDTGLTSSVSVAGETVKKRMQDVGHSSDIDGWELECEVGDGAVQLWVSGAASGYTATAPGRTIHNRIITGLAGPTEEYRIYMKHHVAAAPAPAVLYWWRVYEVHMIAGDFP